LKDLKIEVAPTRNRDGLSKAIQDNANRNWGMKPSDAAVVAHAKAENAEVWTYDDEVRKKVTGQSDNRPVTADEYRKVNADNKGKDPSRQKSPREQKGHDDLTRRHGLGRLAPESNRPESKGPFKGGTPGTEIGQHNQVRQRFDLAPRLADASGRVSNPKRARNATRNRLRAEKVAQKAATQPRTKAVLGVPPRRLPPSAGPSGRGAGVAGGIELLLRGALFVLEQVGDYVVGQRIHTDWERLRPGVEQHLSEHPELGSLVLIRYYQDRYVGLRVAYGMTLSDARRAYADTPELQPADQVQDWWTPPTQPVNWSKVETPFPKYALARFEPGNEGIMRVRFTGDDEYPFDEMGLNGYLKLDNPDRIEVKFLVLAPPPEVSWAIPGRVLKASVPLTAASAGTGERLKAVDLDAGFWDRGNAVGVPVFPANEAAEYVFKRNRTAGLPGSMLSWYRNLDLMAWVRPEDIVIVEVFK
jgi:hypothetical protein